MDIDFYNETEAFLIRKATANGVTDLDKYYRVTDTRLPWYRNFDGDEISRCFAQLAFHAQNATMISNIVKFEENYDFLYSVCCGFNPTQFFDKYCQPNTSFDEQVNAIVSDLRYDPITNPDGLVWDSTKSKEENKDNIAKRYAKALIKGATYLKGFTTKQQLIDDILAHKTQYCRSGVVDENKKMIDYFIEKMGKGSGFSVALTCDFLKELDEEFDFLAKPDIHIMDVMAAFKNKAKDYYYYGDAKKRECLRDFQKLVANINEALSKDNQITVYKLDRMIWLICSGKFFLDNVGLEKKDYLEVVDGIEESEE